MAWKFEKFIFDLLPAAQKVDALVYPRESCFAPLKNFSGNDSFATVAEAIERRDQQILSAITENNCDLSPLEISQDFYYPTPELLSKWKGKSISSGYIVG
jgi:UDP-N-acetylglucosamine/UDP-N-acetylgalactosamine diphosphorylase